MTAAPLIALIHGTPAAIAPAASGIAEGFPDAQTWNILDDRLLKEAGERGGLTPELDERMQRLIQHARTEGAAAVLLTCSMYGRSAMRAAGSSDVPILAADEAVFDAALTGGYATVLVLATLEASRADTLARLADEAALVEGAPSFDSLVPEGAFAATGDDDALLAAVTAALADHSRPFDAVLLAQYTLAPIASRLQQHLGLPVLSGPAAAAAALRARLA
jgi:hypothetical protein